MKLFNFEISIETHDNEPAGDGESISKTFSNHESHATNPIIVGSISLTDDLPEIGNEQGHYALSQNSDSLDKSIVDSATFAAEVSALPDGLAAGSSDNIKADLIVVSNANFRG